MAACANMVRTFCGELTGERKGFVEKINAEQRGKLEVTQVPCYSDYLQVHCTEEIPATYWQRFDSLAATLGWIEVLVYDRRGNLIKGNTGSM